MADAIVAGYDLWHCLIDPVWLAALFDWSRLTGRPDRIDSRRRGGPPYVHVVAVIVVVVIVAVPGQSGELTLRASSSNAASEWPSTNEST